MRIIYLCADLGISIDKTNGSSAHVQAMVTAMRDLGHEVTLLMSGNIQRRIPGVDIISVPRPKTTRMLKTTYRKESAALEGMNASAERVSSALGRILQNIAIEQTLSEVIEALKPHLIYERYSAFTVVGGAIARRNGIRHMLEVNSPLAWEGRTYRDQALGDAAILLERTAFAGADAIRAVSEELVEDLVAAGAPRKLIHVVPNGVDTAAFSPDVEPVSAAFSGVPDDRFVVGFVGSLRPWHGMDILAQAFTQLSEDPRIHLLVVGDGPGAADIAGLSAAMPDKVTHVPSVEHNEVPQYLARMDAVLAPYPPLERFFFSPLKILEAMASGRPIVASDLGQIQALLAHEQTALLTEPGNPDALAKAILRLADDPPFARQLAKAAHGAAQAHAWSDRAARVTKLHEAGA